MTLTIETKTPYMILTEAADLLDQDLWVQDTFHTTRDGKVCHCADGALMVVAGVETVTGIAEKDGYLNDESGLYFEAGQPITESLIDQVDTADYAKLSKPYRVANLAANIAAKQVGGHPFESIIGYNDAPERTREDVVRVLRSAVEFIPEAELRLR